MVRLYIVSFFFFLISKNRHTTANVFQLLLQCVIKMHLGIFLCLHLAHPSAEPSKNLPKLQYALHVKILNFQMTNCGALIGLSGLQVRCLTHPSTNLAHCSSPSIHGHPPVTGLCAGQMMEEWCAALGRGSC